MRVRMEAGRVDLGEVGVNETNDLEEKLNTRHDGAIFSRTIAKT